VVVDDHSFVVITQSNKILEKKGEIFDE